MLKKIIILLCSGMACIFVLAPTLSIALRAPVTWPDVDSDAWYADAIQSVAQLGWIQGYDNGKYGVGDSVSREELATILYRVNQTQESIQWPLRNIVCSNKSNFLNNADVRGGQLEIYEKALDKLCHSYICGPAFDLHSGEILLDRVPAC